MTDKAQERIWVLRASIHSLCPMSFSLVVMYPPSGTSSETRSDLSSHRERTRAQPVDCIRRSDANEQVPHALCVPNDLITSQLAFSKHTVAKGDGYLADCEFCCAGPHEDLHLKHVAFGRHFAHQLVDYWTAVQPGDHKKAKRVNNAGRTSDPTVTTGRMSFEK